jgi:hypothetical protein
LCVVSFLALGIISLVKLWRPACQIHDVDSWLAAGLFGVQLAMMVTLFTVWLADDFSFQWLFNCGYIASTHAYTRLREVATKAPAVYGKSRWLVPGHPLREPGGAAQSELLPTT